MSETGTEPIVCPECGKDDFKMPAHLASHRKHKHGVQPEGRAEPRRSPASSGFGATTLQGRIRDACLGTAAVAAITDPRIYIAVEGTVDQFAISWANVAKASPTARRYIEALLTGGVWIPAIMSTIVMAVAVLMATDKLPPQLNGLGYYALGQMDSSSIEKLQAMYQAPPAAGNGGDPVGPEAAADQ
ncbi:MAG TPA: hypothetical protein VMW35_09590 [Myxococcota bacterium]|nr:hypothetical protein [Myxococcota bacterium]